MSNKDKQEVLSRKEQHEVCVCVWEKREREEDENTFNCS